MNLFKVYAWGFTRICKHMCDSRDTGFYQGAIDLINKHFPGMSAQFIITNLRSSLASVASSYCILTSQAVPRDMWQMYNETLDTDVQQTETRVLSLLPGRSAQISFCVE